MQKIYFLLMALLCCLSGYSANCVTTTKVGANYKTQQVTFILTWTGCNGTTHLNKAWCFVDFQTVDAAGNKGAWQRATISGTPSVVNGTYAAGNATGFWVTGTNGQSATVTVKLGNASGKFNWCAIATDYPPQATFTNPTNIKFGGTLPFVLNSGVSVTATAKTYTPAAAFTSFTDKTNAPGTINCGSAVITPALVGGGSVCATATLSVTNSQTSMSYTLYKSTTAVETKAGVSGTLTFTPQGAGAYRVIASNRYYASCTATSGTQTVTLYPAVTQSNPVATTICYNATNTFSLAAATGGNNAYTYQWQQSTNNSTWSTATGTSTNAAYTTPALTSNMYYRRVVTSCGNSATSTAALVTVRANVTQSNPSVATICYNATNTFSLAAATGGDGSYTYLWQQSGNNSTWTNATGTRTNAAYTTPALTANMYYRRVVTSCGNSATSTAALVTVRANVTQSNPAVATICYNATNTFSLAAATGGDGSYTYLWQQSGNNSTWTNATGTRTNAAYTTPALTANMYYRRVVTSCGNSATSTAALVTINAAGSRDTQPGTCSCRPGLTLVNAYCRDLAADAASTYITCGVELKAAAQQSAGTWTTAVCPSGWRLPTVTEAKCAINAGIWEQGALNVQVATSATSGCDYTCCSAGHCGIPLFSGNSSGGRWECCELTVTKGVSYLIRNDHPSWIVFCVR